MADPLDALGWDDEMKSEAAETITKPSVPRKDPRICICGHPARAHSSEGITEEAATYREYGKVYCKYGRMKCPCEKFVEVGTCESVQSFTFKTHGADAKHALTKGIQQAKKTATPFEWTKLERTACTRCGEDTGPRHLVALNGHGQVSSVPQSFNVFLCETHYIEMGGAQA